MTAADGSETGAGVTPMAFRRVIGSFATGVAVITTATDGEQFGMTLNSLASVSLDPLIVLVCIGKGSRTGAAIRERGRFAINLLSEHQEEISRRFVSREQHRFRRKDASENPWQVPLMEGALAHVVCDVHLVQEVGDHEVIYGRVLDCGSTEGKPLLFWRGGYSMLRDTEAHTT
jgi:3-hydroxy-9,10-secoandrosta-1,3,5(10)-triene-9,17-dione monooxygenase reductase component